MALSLGTRCVQLLFCLFSFVILLLGLILLGVGIFVRIETQPVIDLVDLNLAAPAYLLIASGAFVWILGCTGCCGACCKAKGCLICYSVFVFLIIILELAAGLFAYKKGDVIVRNLKIALENGVKDHYARNDTTSISITIVLDMFQQRVRCCGATGPEDYQNSYWQNATGHVETVPPSCCRKKVKGCNVNVTIDSYKIFNTGCVELGGIWAEENILVLRNVGIGIGAVELVGILSAMCLWYKFKHEKKGRRK